MKTMSGLVKDHFTELLLVVLFVLVLFFVVYMSHIHNDQLANKLMEFDSGVLGALFLAMRTTTRPSPPTESSTSPKE